MKLHRQKVENYLFISLRLRKGIYLASEVTSCIHSTLMRRRMAMTLLMRGGEEPRWTNSSEAQSWADRYFTENTTSCAQPISECASLVSRRARNLLPTCGQNQTGSNHILSNQIKLKPVLYSVLCQYYSLLFSRILCPSCKKKKKTLIREGERSVHLMLMFRVLH